MSFNAPFRIGRSLTRKQAAINKAILRAEGLLEESKTALKMIHTADLIKSVLHTIPRNAQKINVCDWEINGATIKIELPATLTPLDYMQYLYKRAHRLIRGRSKLEEEIIRLHTKKEQIEVLISQFEAGQDIEIPLKGTLQKAVETQAKPFRTYLATTGEKIYVGKNKESNQHISFHLAKGDDLWMHAEGVEGAHVVLKKKGEQIPPQAIEEAALLAAYFSKKRVIGTQVPVSVTKRSDLYRKKKMAPGAALMRTHTTVIVTLDKDRIQKLLNHHL